MLLCNEGRDDAPRRNNGLRNRQWQLGFVHRSLQSEQRKLMSVSRLLKVMALTALLSMAGCKDEKSFAEHYPGPWKDEPKIELVRLLVAQGARGCGEFWWRTRDGETGQHAEYLVYCSRDGKTWKAWLLWPGTGKASGPTGIEDGPPPPGAPERGKG